jgi:pimeloyl-ACP methyl ester carboxylesterase
MEPTHGYVETPEVRLHYIDWGGDGPPLFLLHANGFHARVWDPLVPHLRDRFRVIALDQRGHGDSGLPSTDFGWSRFAEDLYQVIAALGVTGCFAAGHSFGGTSVAVCAARHPGSIRRAVLIDPVLRGGPDERAANAPNRMAESARRRRAVWDSPHQFEETMRGRAAFARWRPEFLHAYAQHGLRRRPDGHYELKCRPEVEAAVFEAGTTFDPWPDLVRLPIPVLLLRATATGDRPSPSPPDADRRIPHCREVAVAASHFIPMEEPEAVLAAFAEHFSD